MKADTIRVGDTLRLKKDNPYGWGTFALTVLEVRPRAGYKTPWIVCSPTTDNTIAYFKPSDFQGRA